MYIFSGYTDFYTRKGFLSERFGPIVDDGSY